MLLSRRESEMPTLRWRDSARAHREREEEWNWGARVLLAGVQRERARGALLSPQAAEQDKRETPPAAGPVGAAPFAE